MLGHFGEDIEIFSEPGKKDTVLFKKTTAAIVSAFYESCRIESDSCEDDDEDKMIAAVADIILSETKDIPPTPEGVFPCLDDITDMEEVI